MIRMLAAATTVLVLSVGLTGCKALGAMAPGERPVELDFAAPLDEAIAAGEAAGYDVVGFEFSSGPVHGGIALDGRTADEALADFEAEYGTVPVVVMVVVDSGPPFAFGPIVRDVRRTSPRRRSSCRGRTAAEPPGVSATCPPPRTPARPGRRPPHQPRPRRARRRR